MCTSPNTSCLFLLAVALFLVCPWSTDGFTNLWARRRQRYLVFPPGIGNKLQIIAGFGVPIDVPRTSLTYGLILKTNYILPTNATQYTNPYVGFQRRGMEASRWHLYKLMEGMLTRLNAGGKDCLLRAVCQAAETPLSHNGIMGELLHIVLTPTSTEDDPVDGTEMEYYRAEVEGQKASTNITVDGQHCERLYPSCTMGILDVISILGHQLVDTFM